MAEDIKARLAEMERLLAKRKNAPGYGDNAKFIASEIARLKAELA